MLKYKAVIWGLLYGSYWDCGVALSFPRVVERESSSFKFWIPDKNLGNDISRFEGISRLHYMPAPMILIEET